MGASFLAKWNMPQFSKSSPLLSLSAALQRLTNRIHFSTPWTAAHQLFCPWDFTGKGTGVGGHFFLQGIFQTQGSNLDLLHYRQILYRLNYKGSPDKNELQEMATHSSIPAWGISWTAETGGLQSMWSQRVGHNIATEHACTGSTALWPMSIL